MRASMRVLLTTTLATALAGGLAGHAADKPVVGLVMKSLANEFFKSMEEGAVKYAKQDGTFTGDFTNTDKGRNVTQQFISQGADIIFPVAGPVGLGAAAAVKAAGNVDMIWVDSDGCVQAAEFCNLFITSAEKRIDVAVFTAIRQVVDGNFNGGSDYVGTLQNDGVGLASFHDFDSKVPQSLKSEVDKLKKGIIAGSVSVDPKDYS